MTRILFVCLGNICRSPTADAVLRKMVQDRGLADLVEVDSAGTAAYHIGNPPDSRSTAAGRERGYDLSVLRARKARAQDFEDFDWVLAMDRSNLEDLAKICPPKRRDRLRLFLSFATETDRDEVPDPYYSGPEGFQLVLDLVEDGCRGLLDSLAQP